MNVRALVFTLLLAEAVAAQHTFEFRAEAVDSEGVLATIEFSEMPVTSLEAISGLTLLDPEDAEYSLALIPTDFYGSIHHDGMGGLSGGGVVWVENWGAPGVPAWLLRADEFSGGNLIWRFSQAPALDTLQEQGLWPVLLVSGAWNRTLGDCNDDGVVSILDANCTPIDLLDALLGNNSTLRGDVDGIGGVKFPDFLVLSGNFGGADAMYTEGDFDKDGAVGFSDFLLLSANFGQGSDFGAGIAAVPEPSNFGLPAALATILALSRTRPVR